MTKITDLDPVKQAYVNEYLVTRNPYKAADTIGVLRKDLPALVSDPVVMEVIHSFLSEEIEAQNINLARLNKILIRIADYNPKDPANEDMPKVCTHDILRATQLLRDLNAIGAPKRIAVAHFDMGKGKEFALRVAQQICLDAESEDGDIIDVDSRY